MSYNTNKTLTFDEKVKGWTSFHSYFPDFMVGMNNKFFSFNNGELYEHHSDNVARNNYYGTQYSSKISVMINDAPSDIKELQTLGLEGNASWDAVLKAFVSNSDETIESTIASSEFVQKEGKWYAYARRNESSGAFDSKSTYGLGTISDLTATTFVLNGGSTSLCIGDTIVRGSNSSQIGVITDIDGDLITLDTTAGLVNGDYVVGMKDSRIEGGNLRGYVIRVDLENDAIGAIELFSINAEVMKSFS